MKVERSPTPVRGYRGSNAASIAILTIVAIALLGALSACGTSPITGPDVTEMDSMSYFKPLLKSRYCQPGRITYSIVPTHPLIDSASCDEWDRLSARRYRPVPDSVTDDRLRLSITGEDYTMNGQHAISITIIEPTVGYHLINDAYVGDQYFRSWIRGGGLVEITSYSDDTTTVSGRFALELWTHVFGLKDDPYIVSGTFNQIPITR